MKILRYAGVMSLVLTLAGTASASIITQDTRNDNNKGPSSASQFLSSFNALTPGGAGYGVTTNIAVWHSLNNFYGAHSSVATKTTAKFYVSAAQAGSWNLQAGGDGGLGVALFLDGALIGSRLGNVELRPAVTVTNVAIGAGMHTLAWVTYEDCCDGPESDGQFQAPGSSSYTYFAAADGLTPIPEPSGFGPLALGVIALAGLEVVRSPRSPTKDSRPR